MSNIFFSGRISQELYDKVVEFCEMTGKSKTDILKEALAKYIGLELKIEKNSVNHLIPKEILNKLEELNNIVINHDKEIKALKELINVASDNSDNILDNRIESTDKHDEIIIDNTLNNIDNTNDNTENIYSTPLTLTQIVVESSEKWKPIPENQMATITGIHRNTLRGLRAKIDKGLEVQPIESVIDGILCKIEYYGEDKENTKKPRKLWIAIPNSN